MKASEIEVGKTYVNRGAGTTWRKVLAIGDECRPERWRGVWASQPPQEPGVLFVDSKGKEDRLYISSFAAWCGREKTD